MPASARLPSGTFVDVLWGQPEQKYGVRETGAAAPHLGRLAAVEPVGLDAEHLRDFRIEIKSKETFGQRGRQ